MNRKTNNAKNKSHGEMKDFQNFRKVQEVTPAVRLGYLMEAAKQAAEQMAEYNFLGPDAAVQYAQRQFCRVLHSAADADLCRLAESVDCDGDKIIPYAMGLTT